MRSNKLQALQTKFNHLHTIDREPGPLTTQNAHSQAVRIPGRGLRDYRGLCEGVEE